MRSKEGNAEGKKYDTGKLRWELVPKGVMSLVVKVLTNGALKYSDNNWQKVRPFRERYYGAMKRHIDAWWEGEILDPDDGVHHLAHAICCAMFLIWGDNNGVV